MMGRVGMSKQKTKQLTSKIQMCILSALHLLLLKPNPPLLGGGDQLLDRDLQPKPPRLPAGDLDLDLLL